MFNKFNFQISKITAKSYIRPEISGVFVQPNRTVATDSFRLIEVERTAHGKTQGFKSFILPKENAENLSKLDDVGISMIKFNDLPKIDGEYPKYKQIMQEKGKYTSIKLNPKLLKDLIDFYAKFSETEIEMRVPVNHDSPIFLNGENKITGQKSRGTLMPIQSS